jgi:hypothetical protein
VKNQGRIIGIVVLVVIFGALGAGYFQYIQPQFEQYGKDEKLRASLDETYNSLKDTFLGYKPELLMTAWQDKLQPWRGAREERATYFNYGDWFEHEKPAVDTARMIKFWYSDTANKMTQDFYMELYKKQNRYDNYPQDFRMALGVATDQEWQGRDVSEAEVVRNLDKLAYGLSACRLLLKHNVPQLSQIRLWTPRITEEYQQMLFAQTVGLQFTISTKDFVKMLDDLRTGDRYFSVDALKITYPYIGYNVEPQLQVSMLLSQTKYRKAFIDKSEGEPGAATAAGAARPGMGPASMLPPPRQAPPPPPEPGVVGKVWKWIKNNILFIH